MALVNIIEFSRIIIKTHGICFDTVLTFKPLTDVNAVISRNKLQSLQSKSVRNKVLCYIDMLIVKQILPVVISITVL